MYEAERQNPSTVQVGLRAREPERERESPLVGQSPHDLNVTHFETAHMNVVNTSWTDLQTFPEELEAMVRSVDIHISH